MLLLNLLGDRVSLLVMCNDRLIEVDTFLFALPRSSLLLFDVFCFCPYALLCFVFLLF